MVATGFVIMPQCEPNVVSVSELVRSKGDKHPPPPRLGGHWPVTYPRERARARQGVASAVKSRAARRALWGIRIAAKATVSPLARSGPPSIGL